MYADQTTQGEEAAVPTAAIYTRVSTSRQEDGTSPDVQEKRCRGHIAQQGWTLVDVFHDGGVSGSLASRPQLDHLASACLAGDAQMSVANTAAILNAEGMLPRPNRATKDEWRWTSYRLRRILKRASLMGRYTCAKRGSIESISFDVPPVIDEGRWLELQQVLKKSERRSY